MVMVGVDNSSLQADSHPKSVSLIDLRDGSHLALSYIHQMNWVNSRNHLCYTTAPYVHVGPTLSRDIIIILSLLSYSHYYALVYKHVTLWLKGRGVGGGVLSPTRVFSQLNTAPVHIKFNPLTSFCIQYCKTFIFRCILISRF